LDSIETGEFLGPVRDYDSSGRLLTVELYGAIWVQYGAK
jgi:hypothetical protein